MMLFLLALEKGKSSWLLVVDIFLICFTPTVDGPLALWQEKLDKIYWKIYFVDYKLLPFYFILVECDGMVFSISLGSKHEFL